jgi:hypothetical protein
LVTVKVLELALAGKSLVWQLRDEPSQTTPVSGIVKLADPIDVTTPVTVTEAPDGGAV